MSCLSHVERRNQIHRQSPDDPPLKPLMIHQKQPVEGTQMLIWGDPKGGREFFVVQSIKAALALWSAVSDKPGVLVISAQNPDELALLFQNPANN